MRADPVHVGVGVGAAAAAAASADTMTTDSTITTSPSTTTSPMTNPSSLGSGLAAKRPDSNFYRVEHGFGTTVEPRVRSMAQHSRDSRHGSYGSSGGRSFDEKRLDPLSPQYGSSTHASAGPHPNGHEGGDEDVKMNGYRRDAGPNRLSKSASSSKKEKRGGFKNTLRRMFGRGPKTRISMPTPMVQPRHDPEEFITSAANQEVKPPRAASVPAGVLPRTSALSSHPPHRHTTAATTDTTFVPPPPERRAPERPPRPRRASVPSVLLNREDVQALEAVLSDPNLQEKQEQNLEAGNIGFAVTNGSNPKRRSRSVGAFPSADHRMSPIQWHHVRRRSDEIRYWRESTPLTMFDQKGEDARDEQTPDPTKEPDVVITEEPVEERETRAGPAHDEPFNFGLAGESADVPDHQERIGLEERIVTLEIRLMDFEYTLSKIQSGEDFQPTSPRSPVQPTKVAASLSSYEPSDAPPSRFEDDSPAMMMTMPTTNGGGKSAAEEDDAMHPTARPTSIATTLKPGPLDGGVYTSADKPPPTAGGRSMRASLTGLSIEHYTTLLNLLRQEQSARQRLEEQVLHMQAQLDRLLVSPPAQPTHSHHGSGSQRSQSHSHSHSHSHSNSYSRSSSTSSPPQSRRHGIVGSPSSEPGQRRRLGGGISSSSSGGVGLSTYHAPLPPPPAPLPSSPPSRQPPLLGSRARNRSSSYGTDTTDTTTTTDDDEQAYHDAFVTPLITPMEYPPERGEFERGAFERIGVAEGVAF